MNAREPVTLKRISRQVNISIVSVSVLVQRLQTDNEFVYDYGQSGLFGEISFAKLIAG